jgi:predicted RNA-binding protein
MCLSTVYKLGEGGTRQMLAEYVSSVTVSGAAVTLTDIMGNETVVPGFLRAVDLVKNVITVDNTAGGAATEEGG